MGAVERRIRNKTAAGPDGLLNPNLQISGLPIIIINSEGIGGVEVWRPIRICPILERMFSSILDD